MKKTVVFGRFNLPTKIFFSTNFADCPPLPEKKVLVITSRSLSSALVNMALKSLLDEGAKIEILYKEGGEPESSAIADYQSRTDNSCKAILAIGGGSTIDTAKALALVKLSGKNINDYEFGETPIIKAIPVYAVPTTCGSGSEVTPYSVITNSDTGRKFTLASDQLRPVTAYINPAFIGALPEEFILASSLDAFIHCLEAMLNVDENQLISPWAIEGMRLVFFNLEAALKDSSVEELQTRLARAALYGGISIAHSRTGLAHTMSVAFAEFTCESHGLLNAKLLPYTLRFNLEHFEGKLASIVSAFGGRNFDSDNSAFDFLCDWLNNIIASSCIADCSEVEANKDHVLDRVLQDKGLAQVNPAPVNRQTLAQLTGDIFDAQV